MESIDRLSHLINDELEKTKAEFNDILDRMEEEFIVKIRQAISGNLEDVIE
jgi:hypothetical protein